MQVRIERSVWVMARWTCAAILAASAFALILGQLSQSAAGVGG
jgi:hypothetical protein